MVTDIFIKKRWVGILLSLISFFLTFSFLTYAVVLKKVESVWIGKNFYFLTDSDEYTEVGAYNARLDGGAGVLLEDAGREYLVLSVFLEKENAKTVQTRLKEEGYASLNIVKKGTESLYFKGNNKAYADTIVTALEIFYNYMERLEFCISELEKGMTQDLCKRTLKNLEKQIRLHGNVFSGLVEIAQLYKNSADKISSICQDVIYLKDLRSLLCWQADNFVSVCSKFSL